MIQGHNIRSIMERGFRQQMESEAHYKNSNTVDSSGTRRCTPNQHFLCHLLRAGLSDNRDSIRSGAQ